MYELKHIDFSYGDKLVLKDFSLSLPQKGVVCLFGSSGLGKTTVLRLIAGLEKPKNGSLEDFENKRITFIFQEDRLLPWRTAKENVALALGNTTEAKEKALAVLSSLGLENDADRYPDEMSGGMCRRVAAARALAPESDIILADEPTGNLDSKTSMDVILLMQAISRQFHQTTIMITHNEEIAQMADRTIRIEDGKVVSGGVKYAR